LLKGRITVEGIRVKLALLASKTLKNRQQEQERIIAPVESVAHTFAITNNRSNKIAQRTVQRLAFALHGIDNVHGRHCRSTSQIRVQDGIFNDAFQKDF
jgi:hypothetical protein